MCVLIVSTTMEMHIYVTKVVTLISVTLKKVGNMGISLCLLIASLSWTVVVSVKNSSVNFHQ